MVGGGIITPHICLIYQKTNFPFIFEEAARLKIDLTLVHHPDDTPPTNLPAVRWPLPINIENEGAAIEQLRAYQQKNPFDGILTLWEGAVPFVARAAAALKLPSLNPEAAALTRNKGRVREKLRQAGLNTPTFVRIEGPRDFEKIKGMTFPVVEKPAHGFGSLGVIRSDNLKELQVAVANVKDINRSRLGKYVEDQSDVVVEEYIDGPEYVAETFAINGKVYILSIGYKGYPKGPYFEESVYIAQAKLSEDVKAAIIDQVQRATLVLGITDGPTHTELRLRHHTTPFILEIGARLGGSGGVVDMVRNSVGIDLARLVFDHAMGRVDDHVLKSDPVPKAVALFYIIPVGSGGILEKFEGLETVKEDPATLRFVQFTKPGERLAPYPDFCGYTGMIYSKHVTYGEAEAYLERISRILKVRYSPSENMAQDPKLNRGFCSDSVITSFDSR